MSQDLEQLHDELTYAYEWNGRLTAALNAATDNGNDCRGMPLGEGLWSGCTASESGATDCPACGEVWRVRNLIAEKANG